VVVVVVSGGVGAAHDCNNNIVTFMPSRLVGGTVNPGNPGIPVPVADNRWVFSKNCCDRQYPFGYTILRDT
jgi:hypothetical protein